MTLEQAIAAWDGFTVGPLEAAYERFGGAPSFDTELVGLVGQARVQVGATWLLKHHLECGKVLSPKVADALWRVVGDLEGWAAKLHVLQCMSYVPVSAARRRSIECFLCTCVSDDSKLVRAWAYSGWYQLAIQYPSLRDAVRRRLERASDDEAASVRARIRAVLRTGFPA